MNKLYLIILAFSISFAAHSRDSISIVGSSTVFPYATIAAERFSEEGNKAPTVEPTGTGGGMKLFCSGIGESYPDITNASRPMKAKEAKLCLTNGVTDVIEVIIGNDGLTFSNSVSAERFNLKKEHIFLAMAAEVPLNGVIVKNPFMKWSEIDSSYPNFDIEILVAPPTSGTRDAFDGLVMEKGCERSGYVEIKGDEAGCTAYREDGRTIEMGENDTLIVQKLAEDPERFGYFGYSFLSANQDKIQGSFIDGVEPTMETIQSYEYPNARPLFLYIKKSHIGVIPGIQEYASLITSEDAIGEDGYLTEYGLAPMTENLTDRTIDNVENLVAMDLEKCANKVHPLKNENGFGSACK
ncbi:substrate-binding domain-containing protein [Alphaproteobacteria bacterium]|nr:substrate-binding domain-containing protein [Alphaproteobacteria bacterium]